MRSWQKVNLGQVEVGFNIAQNHSSSPYNIISGHYLPKFTWKVKLGQVGIGSNIAENHSSSL